MTLALHKRPLLTGLMILWLAFAPRTLHAEDEKELFIVAQKAFEDGFYDVSIRYIEQLLKEHPQTEKHIQAKLLLGQCLFLKSQYLKAYDIFQELLQYNDYKDATLYWLGETFLKGSDYKQAEYQFEQLIKLYPNSTYTPQAYYSLGWTLFESGNFDAAEQAFVTLVQNYPQHKLSEDALFKQGEARYNLQQYTEAIEKFQNYLKAYPDSNRTPETLFFMAESFYYLKEYDQAAAYYTRCADNSKDPQLTLMAYVSLGWNDIRLGKFDAAEQSFTKALGLSEKIGALSDDIYLGQATLYSELKKYDKALEAYDNLIKRFPNSSRIIEAYLGKANLYYLQEQYEEAIKAYQTIINQQLTNQNEPEFYEKIYFGLAWAYLKSGNIDESIKQFENIKNTSTNKIVKVSALTQIGDAYLDVDEYSKAIEVYDEILSQYPENVYTDYIQYRQGVALLKNNDLEAAVLSFQALAFNFPKSKYLKDSQYYLAAASFKKGDWGRAIEQSEALLAEMDNQHPFKAETYYILGLSCFNHNDFKKAQQTFEKIIKNFPDRADLVKLSELNIAKSTYHLKQDKEAVKLFRQLIDRYAREPVAEEATLWLGNYFLEQDQIGQAKHYYETFIKTFPESEHVNQARYQLGLTLKANHEVDLAVDMFNQVTPKNPELHARARLAIADMFSRKLDEHTSVQTYKNIITIAPQLKRDAYFKIAEIHKNAKNYTEALEAYQLALQAKQELSNITSAEIQFLIADSYEWLQKTDKAIEEYLKIPYLYTDQLTWLIKAYLRAARLFEDQEDFEKAKTIYNKVVLLNTDEKKFAQERLDWIAEHSAEHNQ